MATSNCSRCGNDFDAAEARGLCPVCLVRTAARREPETDRLRRALESKLRGQYRIIRLVGQGGMGSVYLARDLTLDREVAIKVVKAAPDDRAMHERFRREARTAAKLSHPNIVPLHAYGEIEGMPYFVMGYVRGESLGERLERDGRIPEDEARRVLAEVAEALDHAHRQGVVHRDVKPDNVLLDDDTGRALLTDFGIAKAAGGTESRAVIGTPQYMSPEQAGGHDDIDARSDIYSLGVMGFTMLAGRLPFESASPVEILLKHLNENPEPLRSVAPLVTDATAQVIDRSLAKDPAARWPDARSFKLALGVVDENELPDALRAVEGRGVPALLITFALIMYYVPLGVVQNWGWGLAVSEAWLLIFFFISHEFVVNRLRRDGFSPQQARVAIWREPGWWLWWYPAFLRRPGNAWDRLPARVRHVRWSIFAFIVYLFALYVDIPTSSAFLGRRRPYLAARGGLLVLMLIVVAWFVLTVRARRMLRQTSLSAEDVNRVLLTMPPGRVSFWARPHIAALLAPLPAAEVAAVSPHERMQSIIRQANALSGPLRPVGAQAAIAARQLVEAIEHGDPAKRPEFGDTLEQLSQLLESGDSSAVKELCQNIARQTETIGDVSRKIEDLSTIDRTATSIL